MRASGTVEGGEGSKHPLDAHGLGLVLEEEEDGRDVEEEGEEELEDYARRQHLRKGHCQHPTPFTARSQYSSARAAHRS